MFYLMFINLLIILLFITNCLTNNVMINEMTEGLINSFVNSDGNQILNIYCNKGKQVSVLNLLMSSHFDLIESPKHLRLFSDQNVTQIIEDYNRNQWITPLTEWVEKTVATSLSIPSFSYHCIGIATNQSFKWRLNIKSLFNFSLNQDLYSFEICCNYRNQYLSIGITFNRFNFISFRIKTQQVLDFDSFFSINISLSHFRLILKALILKILFFLFINLKAYCVLLRELCHNWSFGVIYHNIYNSWPLFSAGIHSRMSSVYIIKQ
jgi:hypothetical protein